MQLTLVDANHRCADLSGDAIDVWHCNRDGEDSLYGVTDQNYLRGVQETDASGLVTFSTIFPACYSGRMPHIHIEVCRSATTATSHTNQLKTTQLAFPVDVCTTLYSTATGDDLADLGQPVSVHGAAAPALVQAVGLRRVVSDLVNNALRDGKRADVGVQAHGATVHIVIDDSRT